MELTTDQAALLAKVGTGLAGGRHVFRIPDESIRKQAESLVTEVRKARRAERARNARKNGRVTIREMYFSDYDADKVNAIHELWAEMPKRSLIRDIARAILTDKETDFVLPENWRDIVRAYSVATKRLKTMGAFPVRMADFRFDGMLANYTRKHWHDAPGGMHYGISIHGTDLYDVLQDAYVSALEAGDTVRVSGRNVPTYGGIFRHVRASLSSAAWRYTVATYHGGETVESFDWSQNEPRTIEEWLVYEAWRDAVDAAKRAHRHIERERESRLVILNETRRAMAELVMSGMTVGQIARALGRTVESMVNEMEETHAPAVRFIPAPVSDYDMEDKRTRVASQRAHAERLRAIESIKRATYAA